eukprot:4265125-Amphidinium_carterae.1
MERLCKELLENLQPGVEAQHRLRLSYDAVPVLAEASVAMFNRLFENAERLMRHRERSTMQPGDVRLAAALKLY